MKHSSSLTHAAYLAFLQMEISRKTRSGTRPISAAICALLLRLAPRNLLRRISRHGHRIFLHFRADQTLVNQIVASLYGRLRMRSRTRWKPADSQGYREPVPSPLYRLPSAFAAIVARTSSSAGCLASQVVGSVAEQCSRNQEASGALLSLAMGGSAQEAAATSAI